MFPHPFSQEEAKGEVERLYAEAEAIAQQMRQKEMDAESIRFDLPEWSDAVVSLYISNGKRDFQRRSIYIVNCVIHREYER